MPKSFTNFLNFHPPTAYPTGHCFHLLFSFFFFFPLLFSTPSAFHPAFFRLFTASVRSRLPGSPAVPGGLFLIFNRDFVLGTTVALVVISSSAKVSSSFEEHLRSTVIGRLRII